MPFSNSSSSASFPLDLIHSDVWGPAPQLASNKYRYYVSFIDDFSKFTWLFPMSSKNEVYTIFLRFKTQIEKFFKRHIKVVQSDWGGEYRKLSNFFAQEGIVHHLSCPHTHEQNSTAERKHRHIVEMGLTLLAHAPLPLTFWDHAFAIAVYTINRIPTPSLNNVSPYEKLFKQIPDYHFLKTLGCACFPFFRPYNSHKLAF